MNCKYKSIFTKRKAFTLIELLIVIAIIGILFIVLVSKVDFATDKAKITGVQTDFRSFQIALETVARENAGFNTFGWDTGDTNGDRIRNSYDKGDTNKNGKQDDGEIFVGSKTYGESWTGICTLNNPADADDKSAIIALEEAINKNLDPKLHITINDDLTITMANGAQDPWKTEYHGIYLSNASADNMDRGAIVMFSNGANQEFGTKVKIEKGIVTAVVSLVDANKPDNNKLGLDDYVLAVAYSYTNGYGETATITKGFSNNQTFLTGNGGNEFGITQNGNYIMIDWDEVYIRYSNTNLVFKSSADFSLFRGVKINGATIDSQHYIASEGSTVIELKSSYLETLSDGTYGIEIVSEDGHASCNFICKTEKYIIPEGGVYYIGVAGNKIGNYSEYITKLGPGDEFPTPNYKDVYVYQDYEYRYNQYYNDMFSSSSWIKYEGQFGWGVHTLKQNKTQYTPILKTIAGIPITNATGVFYSCSQMISSPEIPSTVISLYQAFKNCSSLKMSPQIPDSVINMSNTFSGCIQLAETPDIPYGVTNLSCAFADCMSITQPPSIPSTVTDIRYAFSGCTKMLSMPIIPYGIVDMTSTFKNCNSLTDNSLSLIPNTVTILESTFYGCQSLVDVSNFVIPTSVTDMDYVFYGCTLLKYVPDLSYLVNVRTMEGGFANCSSLEYAPKLPSKVSFLNSCFKNCTSLKDDGMPLIPMCTYNISNMFAGCTSLTNLSTYSIYGNSSYTLTAKSVFEGCTGLVYAPRFAGFGLSSVQNALKGCTSLTGTITLDIDRIKLFTYDGFLEGIDFEKQNITLIGGSKWIDDLGSTGINYCIGCNGRHKNSNEEHICHGGNATCQKKSICVICNNEYGDFAPCTTISGQCIYCKTVKTVIQSSHNPYDNNQNNVSIGSWDYSNAKSVTITITYQTEYYYDYILVKSNELYLNSNGELIDTEYKFHDYKKTITFENINMLTGSVIFHTDNEANNFYGVLVEVIPNY